MIRRALLAAAGVLLRARYWRARRLAWDEHEYRKRTATGATSAPTPDPSLYGHPSLG